MAPQGYKRCSKCKQEKPLDDFHRCRRERDGRQSKCKPCKLAENREPLRVWREKNQIRTGEHAAAQARRYPEKVAARVALREAVAAGKLSRPSTCEECGGPGREYKDGRAGIHGHHEDYSKPLVVRWLCEDCHLAIHQLS